MVKIGVRLKILGSQGDLGVKINKVKVGGKYYVNKSKYSKV